MLSIVGVCVSRLVIVRVWLVIAVVLATSIVSVIISVLGLRLLGVVLGVIIRSPVIRQRLFDFALFICLFDTLWVFESN